MAGSVLRLGRAGHSLHDLCPPTVVDGAVLACQNLKLCRQVHKNRPLKHHGSLGDHPVGRDLIFRLRQLQLNFKIQTGEFLGDGLSDAPVIIETSLIHDITTA